MPDFVNIASPHGNVMFNFDRDPTQELTTFALGYKQAASRLAAEFSQHGYEDYAAYPILYLYRHSLELYLKALVYRGAKLMGLIGKVQPNVPGLFQRHDLARLLPAVRSVFNAMHWDINDPTSVLASFDEFEQFVRKVDSIDAGSYAFRYPMNRKFQANLPPHFTVNVVTFANIMDWLLDYLEGAADLIEDKWDATAQSADELRQYLAEDGGYASQ